MAAFILFILFLALTIRLIVSYRTRVSMKQYKKRFTEIKDISALKEGWPRFSTDGKKIGKRGVLLLHGYMCAADQFDRLIKVLKRENIPYYAPTLFDHGLSDLHLHSHVRMDDWKREVLKAYDLLSKLYDEVDVLGVSNGGLLAAYLATHRKVRKLQLLVPAVSIRSGVGKLFNIPFLPDVIFFLFPFLSRRILRKFVGDELQMNLVDKKSLSALCWYPAHAISAFKALNQLSESVDLKKVKAKQMDLYLSQGDKLVDSSRTLQKFNDAGLKINHYTFNTSHLILNSIETPKVLEKLMQNLRT